MPKSHLNIYHRFVDLINKDYLFFSHEFDGTMTFISEHIEDILGITDEALLGQKWFEALNIPEEYLAKANAAVAQCAQGIIPRPYEIKFITPEGEIVYLEIQEHPYYDEYGNLSGVDGLAKDITERKRKASEREKMIRELTNSIEEIKTLRGIIPICSYCKKIRNDKGAWDQLEKYISDHTEASFSHGICPVCTQEALKEIIE